MEKPELSVVIPCYNESRNIPILVERFAKFWPGIKFELILVNNGSLDDSELVLEQMMKRYSEFLHVIKIEKNIGYGHGILTGLKEAKADILAYSHADIQTPPEDVIKAFEIAQIHISEIEHILIKGQRLNRRREEQFLTTGLENIAYLFLGYRLQDANGQPKLFLRKFIEKLTSPPFDFSFDVYVMYKAIQSGFRTLTFPVDFGLRLHGKSKWSSSPIKKYKTILGYAKNLLLISFRNLSDKNNPIKRFIKFALWGFLGLLATYGIFYLLYKIFAVYWVFEAS